MEEGLGSNRIRRCTAAALTVAAWMSVGWLVGADANTYLLLGVPLTVAFQRWVAGRPLRALWVRDAPRFHLDRAGAAISVALAATPAYALVRAIGAAQPDPVVVAWLACALAGAVAGGFALRQFRRPTFRALFGCLATAGVIGAALVVAAWLARGAVAGPGVGAGVYWLLLYLPVAFVLEEVFFRGAIDAYVYRPDEGRGWGWTSAVFVSALWALWHLPVVPSPGVGAAIGLLVVHIAIGIPLSFYWRRSGNLAVPAAAHAVVNAVRNGLLGVAA